MIPETKYARSGDVHIAYQVTGEGPYDVVLAPGTVSHLDLDWELPVRGQFYQRFASFCRLIRFDKRGTGLSDRPTRMAMLEERTDDIRAVMDAAGSDRATIIGVSEGASMACLFAATYPERTRSLIVWGGQARWVKTFGHPWGLTPEEHEEMVKDVQGNWPSLSYLTSYGHWRRTGQGYRPGPAGADCSLRARGRQSLGCSRLRTNERRNRHSADSAGDQGTHADHES